MKLFKRIWIFIKNIIMYVLEAMQVMTSRELMAVEVEANKEITLKKMEYKQRLIEYVFSVIDADLIFACCVGVGVSGCVYRFLKRNK